MSTTLSSICCRGSRLSFDYGGLNIVVAYIDVLRPSLDDSDSDVYVSTLFMTVDRPYYWC